jgi:hypothetical protein
MATFDSGRFSAELLRSAHRRADVELHRVDQAVPSYEGRVFLNRPDATRETRLDPAEGFVGSFFVFGKGECWGDDDAHCAEPSDRKFDRRRAPTRYAKVRVRTPEGLIRRLAGEAEGELTLNIVAVVPRYQEGERHPAEDVLRFERVSIVTYA